jgi:hypothetical protein
VGSIKVLVLCICAKNILGISLPFISLIQKEAEAQHICWSLSDRLVCEKFNGKTHTNQTLNKKFTVSVKQKEQNMSNQRHNLISLMAVNLRK